MKKVLILFVGICLSLLAACGPSKVSQNSRTFTVLYNERGETPYRADWLVVREYANRRDVVLDVTSGDDSDYNTLVFQTFAAGTAPDIVLKIWPDTAERLASQGLLLPISDYVTQMPNFQRYIAQHDLENELDRLRLDNGKFYVLPGYQRRIQVQQWIYRRDLFQKHGLGVPETYDELLQSLAFLKDEYPETTPLTAAWGGAHLFAMMGAGHGTSAGWSGSQTYNAASDRWEFAPATENYRAMVRFLARAYQAGVFDPEIFTQNDETYMAKLVDGRALCMVSWITSGFTAWDERLRDNGFAGAEWAPFPVPSSSVGVRQLPSVDRFRKGLVVPARMADDDDLEQLLSFLDWAVYSEEGMTLTAWGVEGESFSTTSDGKEFISGDVIDGTREFGLNTLFDLNENEQFEDSRKPPEIVAFLNESLARNDTADLTPKPHIDAMAIDAIASIEPGISEHVSAYLMDFVTGNRSVEEDWERYLAGLTDRGYQTIEEIWNSAWREETG